MQHLNGTEGESVWKYTDRDNSESESESHLGSEYISKISRPIHFTSVFLFNLCSCNKHKPNMLMEKKALYQLNYQGYFLVEHDIMVYRTIHGILQFKESQYFKHRGEGWAIFLKISFRNRPRPSWKPKGQYTHQLSLLQELTRFLQARRPLQHSSGHFLRLHFRRQ